MTAVGLQACAYQVLTVYDSKPKGDEISVDASTVVNQKLMDEQNAVTPAQVYRNIPGMSR